MITNTHAHGGALPTLHRRQTRNVSRQPHAIADTRSSPSRHPHRAAPPPLQTTAIAHSIRGRGRGTAGPSCWLPKQPTLKTAFMGIITALVCYGVSHTATQHSAASRADRVMTHAALANGPPPSASTVKLAVIAPLSEASEFGATWGEVLHHTAERLTWSNPGFELTVIDAADVGNHAFADSAIVAAVGIKDPGQVAAVAQATAPVPTFIALASEAQLQSLGRLAGRPAQPRQTGFLANLLHKVFASAQSKADAEAVTTIQELFGRYNSDDLMFCFLILINETVAPVPEVANSTKSKNAGNEAAKCMIDNCAAEIAGCFLNTACRTALGCLNGCSLNDQVCSYRCIASYETPQLEAFSLCVLQKHNCLGLDAPIPMVPDPQPMTSFRGAVLTHTAAEDIFVGWHHTGPAYIPVDNKLDFSWRVFAGKNPAYDYFPCQYQLFYRNKAGAMGWYDPVFKVKTLDGREVWRQRHYRVRKATDPGTFKLSVLDNGVTSNEYWRILDCDDDLEWCVFYYSGAAAAAGINYRGGIMVSRTGEWPVGAGARERIVAALDRAGIKEWELSDVNNAGCSDVPLAGMQAVTGRGG